MDIILVALLSPLVCEKGLEHVDWVKFDQINSVGMEGVAFIEGQHSFGGRLHAWK